MIQLLLGSIAIYTLYKNRKSIKRLRDMDTNHQVNNQENNEVIQPPRKINMIDPSSNVLPFYACFTIFMRVLPILLVFTKYKKIKIESYNFIF